MFSSVMHLEAEQKLIKYDIKLHMRIKTHTVVELVCKECKNFKDKRENILEARIQFKWLKMAVQQIAAKL